MDPASSPLRPFLLDPCVANYLLYCYVLSKPNLTQNDQMFIVIAQALTSTNGKCYSSSESNLGLLEGIFLFQSSIVLLCFKSILNKIHD